MIRNLVERVFSPNLSYIEARGLSSDTKPTTGIITGSKFHEVDTGRDYEFDESTKLWHPQSASRTPLTGATVTLGASPAYDGTEKTQAISSVKIGSTTLTTDTDYTVVDNKATLPGSYTLYVVGIGEYSGVLPKAFTVGKGSGSVTASPDTLTLTAGGAAGESALTVTGDGALSAESSDADVATVAIEGDTVTVTPVAAGSATVTVTLAAGTLYTGGTDTIAVTVEAAQEAVDPETT